MGYGTPYTIHPSIDSLTSQRASEALELTERVVHSRHDQDDVDDEELVVFLMVHARGRPHRFAKHPMLELSTTNEPWIERGRFRLLRAPLLGLSTVSQSVSR